MVKYMLRRFGEECLKIKKKGKNKFLAEIGWREFNHTLVNNFSTYVERKLF